MMVISQLYFWGESSSCNVLDFVVLAGESISTLPWEGSWMLIEKGQLHRLWKYFSGFKNKFLNEKSLPKLALILFS
jgi:hypothetical protein